MNITIACPTNRGIQPETFECLLKLVEYSKQEHNINVIVPTEGYTVAENRNYTAVQAVNSGSDYLLMVDDDMTFEENLLEELLNNEKDIIGVAYHSRGGNKSFKYPADAIMSIAEVEEKKYIVLEENNNPKYKDTFECYAIGTGIILINCEVFKKVPQPWFEFEWHENGCCKTGEDWMFCIKAKKYGFKVWTDPKIPVGHLGEAIY